MFTLSCLFFNYQHWSGGTYVIYTFWRIYIQIFHWCMTLMVVIILSYVIVLCLSIFNCYCNFWKFVTFIYFHFLLIRIIQTVHIVGKSTTATESVLTCRVSESHFYLPLRFSEMLFPVGLHWESLWWLIVASYHSVAAHSYNPQIYWIYENMHKLGCKQRLNPNDLKLQYNP